jgi:hypothetical protein
MTNLTWDDLANLYKERTGGTARIKPMDSIFEWATNQSDITLNEDGTLSLTNKEK